jgi:hypothetical protein
MIILVGSLLKEVLLDLNARHGMAWHGMAWHGMACFDEKYLTETDSRIQK